MTISKLPLAAVVAAFPLPLLAQDITILVAPRDTPAHDMASEMEDDATIFAERRIHRAFDRAATHMAACGTCTVGIRLAAGSYTGRGDTGMWTFPNVEAPGASLHITGGWDDAFETRAPFDTPTLLVSTGTRSAPVLRFEGRDQAMAELVLSGLVFDTSPSNSYDDETASLMKSGSSTWGQLSFGYLETGRLVVADNVFMNAPEGVGGPQLRTPDEGLRIDISNNVFFNSVTPWVIPGGASEARPEEIAITGNSFVLNWPRNPDPTTSNPGALEIGNNYATEHVLIEGNLFAWNMGGAIFSQWDHDRSPPITIRGNLFWQNGLMYGASRPDDGAMVGKFNGAAVHSIYDALDLEDDFDWTAEDNDSFDPGFRLDVPQLQTIRYGDAYRGADVATVEAADDLAGLSADEAAALGDLTAQLSALGSLSDDASEDSGTLEIVGPDNSVRNYAPRLPYDEVGIPMPSAPGADAYGASHDRIWTGG